MNKFWDLAPPILIGMAIDVVTYQEDSMLADFGYPDPYDQFLILVAVTVVVWVLESLFEYWFGVLWRNLAQNAQHELRMDAYEHIQNLEMQQMVMLQLTDYQDYKQKSKQQAEIQFDAIPP